VRDYNEDRVSIILNINKPIDRQSEIWPKCSFFAVYDGHGGSACADFLRDNLHQFVTRSLAFPYDPEMALFEGFAIAEKTFQDYAKSLSPPETSGSCAVVLLVVDQICFVANLGDSRAIMSGEKGKKVYCLSKDHKPSEVNEKNRVESAGGRVYITTLQVADEKLQGPSRILPGRLSVSRSFGDIEAKCIEFGGNPNVLLSVPEIKTFKIHPEYDFILLASDGIFDKLSNREAVTKVTEKLKEQPLADLHRQCEIGVEAVMTAALVKKTKDNITVVMIGLDGLINKAKDFIGQGPKP
jgi:protein phosphatase 2C family protein 2/3